MGFKKGNQYGSGRPKGSQNRTTAQIKEYLCYIADHIESDIIGDLDVLSPAERVKTYLTIIEYLLPKLARQAPEQADSDIDINITYQE
jgi:hypothetical protein